MGIVSPVSMTRTVRRRCADLAELSEDALHSGNSVPSNYGQQGCTILRIHGVDVTEKHLITPRDPCTDVTRREHLSDIAISNNLAYELHLRRGDRLSSRNGHYV